MFNLFVEYNFINNGEYKTHRCAFSPSIYTFSLVFLLKIYLYIIIIMIIYAIFSCAEEEEKRSFCPHKCERALCTIFNDYPISKSAHAERMLEIIYTGADRNNNNIQCSRYNMLSSILLLYYAMRYITRCRIPICAVGYKKKK